MGKNSEFLISEFSLTQESVFQVAHAANLYELS